jgi:hypothetical protein
MDNNLRSPALPAWMMRVWHSLLLPTHRHALGWWIGTRVLLFALLALTGFYTGDVPYYYTSIQKLFFGVPANHVLIEYPTPLIWILAIPYVLGWGTSLGYTIAFIVIFVAADALMGYVLWRAARQYGTDPRPAAAFWIWFVLAMGPIVYMRLDFLTAALSAVALLAIVRSRRFTSGFFIGVGAAIKLWPALLWPTAMVDKRAVRRASLGFFGAGAALAIASLIYAGWERLISPLTWQSDRGLQIESIYATPLMIARVFNPNLWPVSLSKYQAFEIAGPGSVLLTDVASWATLVGGVIMAVLYVGWLRRSDRTPIEAGALMVIATLIMIITNKTFSPQYMIWLAGPVAALLTISARHPELLPNQHHLFAWFHRPPHLTEDEHLVVPLTLARHIAIWTLALMVLTQLVYPLMYGYLIGYLWGTPIATLILTIRNLGLLYFAIRLILLAFRSIAFRRTSPDDQLHREPIKA